MTMKLWFFKFSNKRIVGTSTNSWEVRGKFFLCTCGRDIKSSCKTIQRLVSGVLTLLRPLTHSTSSHESSPRKPSQIQSHIYECSLQIHVAHRNLKAASHVRVRPWPWLCQSWRWRVLRPHDKSESDKNARKWIRYSSFCHVTRF